MRTTTNNLRIKSLSRRAIQLVSLVLALTVWAAWIAPSAHTSNRSAPLGPSALAGEVHALFDLRAPDGGPFPSDVFTVTDPNQNTSIRINLPKPDCLARPSDCEDLDVINTLDGFNLLPRVSIPFDGPIDPTTASSESIFLISLGSTLPNGEAAGKVTGINRVVWDPVTNTLHFEADELLDQHTRYVLIVTGRLRDAAGNPINASEPFQRFRHNLNFGQTHDPDPKNYRKSLLDALAAAQTAGVQERDIVSASVFTTQSSTAMLEKIRDQIKSAMPAPADFNLGSGGTRTVFPLDGLTGITFGQQIGVAPPTASPTPLNLSLLRIIPGAVGQVAFGKYVSPDYMVHPGEYIPEVGTRSGIPQVQSVNEVFFNLYLPSGTRPADGWPAAIFGHGSATNKNNQPLEVAATMAAHGIATIVINYAGNGLGPLGTLTVNRSIGAPVTFLAGGRSLDQNHDNVINEGEGRNAAPPWSIITNRDAARQTVADLMQLVRVIEVGMDVDGDGLRDMDPSRIYFFGHSAGGMIGTFFLAVEPNVRAGVFNSVGTPADNLRLSPMFRSGIGNLLASRMLINSPGLTKIGGVAVGPPFFNENLPLREQPPVINTVVGAMEIQEVLDHLKWASQSASSLACAPYLRKTPLVGMPAKSVVFQFNIGDQIATNPTTTAVLRAGDLADRATYFRNDLAYAENNLVPQNPHLLIRLITTPSVAAMARGIQEQIAVFLASDGNLIIHPEPSRFFEVPIRGPLPEDLNFIPATCAYSISPTSQSLSASGGDGSVSVTTSAGCPWQASNRASWITINSRSNGSGDGTVNFSVAANTEPNPRTATLTVAGQTFTVNQSGAQPNPIDDSRFFVRQHYLDFLGREPDPPGLAFWVDNIESCGSDRECRQVRRINTSAAFFLSIEFQETGYLAYRLYKAAYGDATSPDGKGAVPIIRFQEFLPDTHRIGQGVIVNQGEWRTQLENNKRDFAFAFVQRADFLARYPGLTSAAAFVYSLNANAGDVLNDAERTALISELSPNPADAALRADVLQKVAENFLFMQAESNRAFVLMQYYGYLRRNPDEGPDSNFDGYNFWLNKLNQFNGNFVNAEMVKAFIDSREYRRRFSP